jgi:hypothetical protein
VRVFSKIRLTKFRSLTTSRAYATMSRTKATTAILHYHQVVGYEYNLTTGAPSTIRGALSSQSDMKATVCHNRQGQVANAMSSNNKEHTFPHPQHCAEHPPPPPPLLRTKIIPLPTIADDPISANSLLAYNPSKVTLEYDL